jgi:hypothetical protein
MIKGTLDSPPYMLSREQDIVRTTMFMLPPTLTADFQNDQQNSVF